LLLLSWDLWFLGYPDQALSRVSEAVALGRDLRHPYTIAFSHYMTSVVHLFRGEHDLAFENAQKSFAISQEQRFLLYSILSRISRGRAAGELGRIGEARSEITLGLDEARRAGVGYMLPMMYSWLADVVAKSGEPEQALALVDDLLSKIDDVTGRAWESELHRQKGELLLDNRVSRAAEADVSLERAVEVARLQGAKSLELRASISLAELWQKHDRESEAAALLKGIKGWFSEGQGITNLLRVHTAGSPRS
jgi:predicted ATPase